MCRSMKGTATLNPDAKRKAGGCSAAAISTVLLSIASILYCPDFNALCAPTLSAGALLFYDLDQVADANSAISLSNLMARRRGRSSERSRFAAGPWRAERSRARGE